MSFKSFKSEFTEVLDYLSGLCKDPSVAFSFSADVSYDRYSYDSSKDSDFKVEADSSGAYWISDYTGKASKLIIPCFVNGLKIHGIGKTIRDEDIGDSHLSFLDFYHIFSKCPNLKSVVIPGSIKGIENFAFAYCDSLEEVIFCKGLNYIGDETFRDCNGLTSLTFPSSLSGFGEGAFWDCANLKYLTFYSDTACEYFFKEQYRDGFGDECGPFSDCPLSTIKAPKGSTYTERFADFYDCLFEEL